MKQEKCAGSGSKLPVSETKSKNGQTRRRRRGSANRRISSNTEEGILDSLLKIGIGRGLAFKISKELCKSQHTNEKQQKKKTAENSLKVESKVVNTFPKETAEEETPIVQPVFNKITRPVIIDIAESNYPDVFLSSQQKSIIQTEIMEALLEQEYKDVKPQFRGCSSKPGWMSITCNNQETAKWLIEKLPEISKVTKIGLKELMETRNPELVIIYLPQCLEESTSKILRRISAQNSDLMIFRWKILKRKNVNNMVQLTILIDVESVKKLKELNYKLNWRFGYVYIRVISKMRKSLPSVFITTFGKENLSTPVNLFTKEQISSTMKINKDKSPKEIDQKNIGDNQIESPKKQIDFVFK